ncbi:HAD-IIA family hydrolase [Rhodococcus daqingensis]|uniref:HAD-IIA family hydrolase n=1 Tax=Rhodococcus daqingensis TaxID=2479363 RepID=A0ABW2S0A9_9NOCA
MAAVEGVLFDIDGVLVTSWQPLAGAAAALAAVRDRGLERAFLTNTTSRTRAEIAAALRDCGMAVDPDEIVTAAALTAEHLRSAHPGQRCLLINHGDIAGDMTGIEFDADRPEVVVLGGAGPEFDHAALSRVVELMLDGVPVVAMQGGLTWATAEGIRIDTGAYLPGLEAAGNARITVVGKPSPTGFLAAAGLMGTHPERTVMIGDDLENDVLAAQRAGFVGVLVRTGKFRQSVLEAAETAPGHVLGSVADLPELLTELRD